jgi:hypothetical protein
MPNLAQNTTNSARDLAQKIARQVAQEPVEILKDVKEQTVESSSYSEQPSENKNSDQEKIIAQQKNLNDQAKSTRRMEALEREIEDIRKQGLFKELQAKISAGENVPLEEYTELSIEQKQVLKAQMEAVKNQIVASNQNALTEVPTVNSKPSRRFGAGQKQQAEKEQTRTEKPVPPSG